MHASRLQMHSSGFSAAHLHGCSSHFCSALHLIWLLLLLYAEWSEFLVRSQFVLLSLCASMDSARLVVCPLFVCVGCVLCPLKRRLRRTPLWRNNHGNSQSRLACPFPLPLLFICAIFFIFRFYPHPSAAWDLIVVYLLLLHTAVITSGTHLQYHHHILSVFNRNKWLSAVAEIWISSSSCQLYCCIRSWKQIMCCGFVVMRSMCLIGLSGGRRSLCTCWV